MGLAACLRVLSMALPLVVVFSCALLLPELTDGEALPFVAFMDAMVGLGEGQSKPRCWRDAGRKRRTATGRGALAGERQRTVIAAAGGRKTERCRRCGHGGGRKGVWARSWKGCPLQVR